MWQNIIMLIKIAEILLFSRAVSAFTLAAALFLLAALVYFRRSVLEGTSRRFYRISQITAAAMVIFFAAKGVILSFAQYAAWKTSPNTEGLLPPHQPIAYYLGYSWHHHWKIFVFSAFFAATLFLAVRLANRLSGNRFFYDEEPYLAAFGALAAPWPGGFIVLFGVFFIGVVLQLVFFEFGAGKRLPLLFFWLPAAIAAILFGDTISLWFGLNQFKI